MINHPKVKHPSFFLPKREVGPLRRANESILDFIADHILPSTLLADVALVVPLLIINASTNVKLLLAVFSGSWIQWWALHILQRSNVKAEAKHDAKVAADHLALSHIATTTDHILHELKGKTPSKEEWE